MQRNKFGVYEYKRRVPKELLEKFPQYKSGFIKFSLQTKDANEAKRLKQHQDAIHAAIFDEARGLELLGPLAGIDNKPPVGVVKGIASHPKSGKNLDDIASLWKQEGTRASKTFGAMRRLVAMFEKKHGRLDIAHISKKDVHEFIEYLQSVLSNRETTSDTLSVSTINKYLTNLGVLLNVAIKHDYISANVAKGMKLKKSVKEKANKRQSFDKSDLETLFNHDIFRNGDGKLLVKSCMVNVGINSRYWLQIVALFTGARPEELAQLTLNDLRNDSGIAYIDINAFDDKGVKTIGSIRKVPIHNELIKLGFLDYCMSVRKAGYKDIFFDLTGYGDTKSHYFSKWFGYHKRKLGIHNPLKVFYSFRHTFIDACRNSKIPRAVYQSITGHAKENVGDGYGEGFNLEILNDEMQRCKIPYSFKNYYYETKSLLNPSNEVVHEVPTTPKAPKQPTITALMNAVSLAEAYNLIGKKHYGKDWVDYEICVYPEGKGTLVNLSQHVKKNHKGQPEMKPLTDMQYRMLERISAPLAKQNQHDEVMRYLNKSITGWHNAKIYYNTPGGSDYRVFDGHFSEQRLNIVDGNVALSLCRLDTPNVTGPEVEVLVDKDGLESFLAVFAGRP